MISVVNADGTKEQVTREELIKRLANDKEKRAAKEREQAAIQRVYNKEKGKKKMAGKTDAGKAMKAALLKKVVSAMGEVPTVEVGASEIGLKIDGMFFTVKITQKKSAIEGL